MEQYDFDSLILAVAKGDMDALETLYNISARGVFSLAFSVVRSSAAAEDIMQDTFVRVMRAAPSFKANGSGRAWIYRIARNLALNAVTRSRFDSLDTLMDESGFAPPSSLSTEGEAVTNAALKAALDKLSDSEREIVVLHSAGLKLSEIAQVLSLPLGTVKWRHAAALKSLRSELNDR